MNDPLNNRLDRLGERFRAAASSRSGAEANPAFLAAVRARALRRRQLHRWLLVGAAVAAAASVALILWTPSPTPQTPTRPEIVHTPPQPIHPSNADHGYSIAEMARAFDHAAPTGTNGTTATKATTAGADFGRTGERRLYAASIASRSQLNQLLNGQ